MSVRFAGDSEEDEQDMEDARGSTEFSEGGGRDTEDVRDSEDLEGPEPAGEGEGDSDGSDAEIPWWRIGRQMNRVRKRLVSKAGHLEESIAETVSASTRAAHTAIKNVGAAAQTAAVAALETKIGNILDNWLRGQRRNLTEDPAMAHWYAKRAQRLWDRIQPDIKLEIMNILGNVEANAGLTDVIKQGDRAYGSRPKRWPGRLRAWIVYHIQPYDKTLWMKFRDRVYWLFMMIKCFPMSQALYFTMHLLLIDKKDDYQLIEFIVQCVPSSLALSAPPAPLSRIQAR